MRPHPRIRKTIKWVAAAMTVLLIAIWVASGSWSFVYTSPGNYTQVAKGVVLWMWSDPTRPSMSNGAAQHEWTIEPALGPWSWAWHLETGIGSGYIAIPFWSMALLAAGITAIAWRLDIRARRRALGGLNLCTNCNYDRTGLATQAACPECGVPPR
jgi:hypothetical protein